MIDNLPHDLPKDNSLLRRIHTTFAALSVLLVVELSLNTNSPDGYLTTAFFWAVIALPVNAFSRLFVDEAFEEGVGSIIPFMTNAMITTANLVMGFIPLILAFWGVIAHKSVTLGNVFMILCAVFAAVTVVLVRRYSVSVGKKINEMNAAPQAFIDSPHV